MDTPERSTEDLVSRYAPVAPAEEREAVASTRKWGVVKIVAAAVLGAVGIGLTFGSRGSVVTVYYGMAWVAAELMLIGLVNAVGGKTWDDLNWPGRVAILIVGILVAIAFLASGLD